MTDDPIHPQPAATPPGAGGSSGDGVMDLRLLSEAQGPFAWPVIRWFAIQLSEFLEPFHNQGRAHGDIRPENIKLLQPWPSHILELGPPRESPSVSPSGDLRALGSSLEALLSPHESDPEARRTLSALAAGEISGAGALNDFLSSGLIGSLPPEADLPGTPTRQPDTFWQEPASSAVTIPKPPPVPRKSPLPLIIGSAAAAVALLGGAAFLLIPRNKPANTQSGTTRQPAEDSAEKARLAEEAAAKLREAEEAAARDLAAKQKAEQERLAAEKAAEEKAAAEKAEQQRLAMERAAADKLAAEKAAEEKAAREIEALIASGTAILEDPAAPDSAKEKTFSDILALAKKDHPKAIELAGIAYWLGHGVAKDRVEASRWFLKGADLGMPRSMLGLGNCYYQGIGVAKDAKQAVEWWTKSAAAGEPIAMSRLGEYYGRDPDARDFKQALYWCQKAADLGVPEAMTNLANLYAVGAGVTKDSAKAITLWEKAAALGEQNAMTELGYKYYNFEVPGKTQEDAFKLFLQAVKAEIPRAMTGLGVCYLTGNGTTADKDEAIKWLRRASELGDTTARGFLQQVESR